MAATPTISWTLAPRDKIRRRLVEAEQDLAVGLAAGEPVHQLHRDVAGIQVGENEHVGLARHGAARRLDLGDFLDQRRVDLQFAVDFARLLLVEKSCLASAVAATIFSVSCVWAEPLVE
jgi:hypothetical protein